MKIIVNQLWGIGPLTIEIDDLRYKYPGSIKGHIWYYPSDSEIIQLHESPKDIEALKFTQSFENKLLD